MAPVIVSLIVIALMVITGVVSWNDVIGNRQGWNVLVWFATLVAMADGLNQVGFLAWLAQRSAAGLAGWPAVTIAVVLIALFFVLHYLFASTTAHATAVLPAFLAAIVAVPGMPVRAVVLTMLYSVGLMGVLTPYATGPAPVWFSAGYIASEGLLEAWRDHGRRSTCWRCSRSSCRISCISTGERVRIRDPGPGPADQRTSGPADDRLRNERMKTYSIAVIPGDGIGQEVVPAAIAVLEAVAAARRIPVRVAALRLGIAALLRSRPDDAG